jgi:hypothetical protein
MEGKFDATLWSIKAYPTDKFERLRNQGRYRRRDKSRDKTIFLYL